MLKKPKQKKLPLKDIIIALGLCHNVTPIDDGIERTFQASSPDEIALVNFAESVGVKLVERTFKTVTIKDGDQTLCYEILNEFPFTSERKRMGILLKF
jgi:phospholipid-translocating ATPase